MEDRRVEMGPRSQMHLPQASPFPFGSNFRLYKTRKTLLQKTNPCIFALAGCASFIARR